VRGSLDLIQGADLSWQLQDVGVSAANGLEARLSGKGTFAGSWDDLLLRGHIEVVNALYDRDLGFGDLLQWLTRQLFPQVESARAGDVPVRLDLVIYSRGGVYLDNNIAKGEMWLDLHLTGSVAQPSLAGRIGILDAEVFYQGRTFTVLGGSIDFRDPGRINPVLNISAESRVSTPDTDYIVSVIVTGTAERPRVQFSADDPALSQNDVLSLVAFGRTGSQLRRESASVSPTATALALLPTGGVEKQVSTLLGVDRFEVSATQARDTGAIEPRVTVGKDITEQLRASVWTSFGVQSRQAVQLEYRWTRRISLLGSWESQTQQSAGAFGGAVKFRFEYWRVPFSLLSSAVPLPADALLPQGTR
jgi:translocation and assembly module TamB